MEGSVVDLLIQLFGPFGALLLLFGWWLMTRGQSRLGEKDREALTQIQVELGWIRDSLDYGREERRELRQRLDYHLQQEHRPQPGRGGNHPDFVEDGPRPGRGHRGGE